MTTKDYILNYQNMGEISISGTIPKTERLACFMQVCLDARAKRVLIPVTYAAEFGMILAELIGAFSLMFYLTP